MVTNHDWAKVIAEPTAETIDRCLQENPFTKALVLKLNPRQSAAIHRAVRAAVAAELLKIEHGYTARPGGLVAPANVAYHLAEKGREIGSWRPSWCVVTTYADGTEEEQPFTAIEAALLDISFTPENMTKKLRMR